MASTPTTGGSLYPRPPGELPDAAGIVPSPGDSKTPTEGEQTKRQAMLFQPANAAVMAGVVGLNGWDSHSWNDWQRPVFSPQAGPVLSPAPGLFTNFQINGVPTAWPGQYTYFRKILNDPTIRIVRIIAYSPVLATKWSVQASKDAPKDAADVIREMMEPLRIQFLEDALRGVDYGWAPFEQVYTTLEKGKYKGMFWLKKLKALMHDITTLYVDNNGNFAGINNNGTPIDPVKCLLYTYDGEAENFYGRGRCQNLLEVVPWWRDANDGAARYDRKIAGVFMVCHYPPGQSMDNTGKLTENWVIAQRMLDSISAGKPIAVCNEFAGEIENTFLNGQSLGDRTRWKLELLEDKGSRQPGFSDRLAYLDRQKARGYLVPERSVFEAQKSGSRADSESHGDVILTQANIINEVLAGLLNGSQTNIYSPINNILRMNWGDEAIGTVKIIPEAIEDDKKQFIRDIAKEILGAHPELLNDVSSVTQLFDQAGFPTPNNPQTDEQIGIKLDGMVAKRIAPPGGVPGAKPMPTEMSRLIHERVNGSSGTN